MTDHKKLEKLFRQHYRQMYRLATMLLHDDTESKDVVHDIFAHLLRESQDLREETAEHYLLTSVRNRCLNVIRSRVADRYRNGWNTSTCSTSTRPSHRRNG